MAAVSEAFVSEFFELHGFLVRQQKKYVGKVKRGADDIDFIVLNPHPPENRSRLPFILGSEDLGNLSRAIVVVKGWHTESFSPSVLANAPAIFNFVQPPAFKQASRIFGDGEPIDKILVVPALPKDRNVRKQSIELLKSKGIDAVLSFYTVISTLIERIEPNRNYVKSDLLQVIRVLKNYEFFKDPQLELFKSAAKKRKGNS